VNHFFFSILYNSKIERPDPVSSLTRTSKSVTLQKATFFTKTKQLTYQVALIRRGLEFLVDPALGLVTVALKQLELVGQLQLLTAACRPLVQQVATTQKLVATLRHFVRGVVLTLNQLAGKLIQRLVTYTNTIALK
jgi:hypothetical protein